MSTLRAALRSRLTTALRDRDRDALSVLRSALAALDNAEAVPEDAAPLGTASSAEVAGAAVGVGATEVERRELTAPAERLLVEAEVSALDEAEQAYAAAGDRARARTAAAGATLLRAVLVDVAQRT